MQQVPIYVSNGDFWGKFEELGDQTCGQAVTLDEALKDKVIDAATECEPIEFIASFFSFIIRGVRRDLNQQAINARKNFFSSRKTKMKKSAIKSGVMVLTVAPYLLL